MVDSTASVSGSRVISQDTLPWVRLKQPARVALLSIDPSNDLNWTFLRSLASQHLGCPAISSQTPEPGLYLDTLQLDSLAITNLVLGGARKSHAEQAEIIRSNADGVVVLVDCRENSDLEWEELTQEMQRFVLEPEYMKGVPLVVLACYAEAKAAMSFEDVCRNLLAPREDYYKGLAEDSRQLNINSADMHAPKDLLRPLGWLVDAINNRVSERS